MPTFDKYGHFTPGFQDMSNYNPVPVTQGGAVLGYMDPYRDRRNALNQANAAVDLQAQEETAAASKSAAERWNAAALVKGRRRAGGSTFRRRGTVFSGASGLDKANISSLTDARRKKAQADAVAATPEQTGVTYGGSLGFFAF